MSDTAFFKANEDGTFSASEWTRGPWSPNHQHGGPPSALLARAFEQKGRELGTPNISRITVNLYRPVPIAKVSVAVEADRAGRKASYLSAVLQSEGKDVIRATALALRDEAVPVATLDSQTALPQAAKSVEQATAFEFPFFMWPTGYHKAMELRVAEGGYAQGPAAMWFRMRYPLLAGETPTPLERTMIAADSGNGISIVLDISKYTFVNPDLSVHIFRAPLGEWVCLAARTDIGPDGRGMSTAGLFDRQGLFGQTVQSLIIERR